MEHEIPFGTLRSGKKGRFPFNQNFRFEFLATSNSEWNSIFKNSQKWDNLVRYTQIFEKIFRTLSFHSTLLPEILKVWVEWVAFRDFSSFRNFWKILGEISTICRCFQIFESFGGMAAQGYLNMFRCSQKFFSATTQKVVCPLLNFEPETF